MRTIVAAMILLALPMPAAGQAQEIHGENSVFAGPGVTIAWGVLKAASEEQTQVILRIVAAGDAYAYVSIDRVDPFTQKRQVVLDGRPLRDRLDVRSLRGTFADFPRREINFYRTATDWHARKPTVTIYYLGVPDTTPEFTSEGALSTYLAEALAKVPGASQGGQP